MKIVSVDFIGDFDNRLYYKNSTINSVSPLLVSKHKYAKRMKVYQEDVTGVIIYDNGLSITACLHAGYCFNGADIPRIVEVFSRVLKHDNPALERGAFFHDPAYNEQLLGVKVSAKILSDVAMYFGLDKTNAKFVQRAVNGNIAKRLYKDRDEFDIENSKFCSITVRSSSSNA